MWQKEDQCWLYNKNKSVHRHLRNFISCTADFIYSLPYCKDLTDITFFSFITFFIRYF